MVKERPLTINLHNPTDTIIWQFGLLILGAVVLYANLFYDRTGYWNLSLIGVMLSGYVLLKPRPLILTEETIKIPQERFEKHSLQTIKSFKLADNTCLKIQITNHYETTTKSLNLRNLTKEDANLLWLWAAKCLNHAQIDLQTRQGLLNWQQYRFSPIETLRQENETSSDLSNENAQLELTFTNPSLLSAGPGLKSLLIITLGQIWLTICLVSTALMLWYITTLPDYIGQLDVIDIKSLLNLLLLLTPFVLYTTFTPAAVSLIAVIVSFMLIIGFLINRNKPNSLLIDNLGLTLQTKRLISQENYSTRFHSHFPWLTIETVSLCKQGQFFVNLNSLLFRRSSGKPSFSLPLNFLRTQKEKQLLSMMLQKQQQNHSFQIDALALDALEGSRSIIPQYTKIWLNSLHQLSELEISSTSPATCTAQPNLEVIHEIASGGQATTYKARRTISAEEKDENNVGEKIAEEIIVLKEFFLPTQNENIYKTQFIKFEKTAALLKTLHHPNLVRVENYFIDGPKACLLLEYIEGTTLAESVIKNGIFSETKVINLALSMCDILTYLHSQNPLLLHLDFTPDNLILDTSGHLKLIDLDSCQVHNNQGIQVDNSRRTIIGKQNYIPREQFQGHPDIRSDIFALGATLFNLTTGEKPAPLATLHPRDYNKLLSENFDAVIAKATAPLADDRYGNSETLKEEFLHLKESLDTNDKNRPTTYIPATAVTKSKEKRKRKKK